MSRTLISKNEYLLTEGIYYHISNNKELSTIEIVNDMSATSEMIEKAICNLYQAGFIMPTNFHYVNAPIEEIKEQIMLLVWVPVDETILRFDFQFYKKFQYVA